MSLNGLGRGRRRRHLNAEVNIINLVDVVLVLLIIFMLTAPMMQNAIELRLPKAVAAPAVITDKDMVISIKSSGQVIIDGNPSPMSSERFLSALPQLLSSSNAKKVFIRGEGRLMLDNLMPIWGALQEAGVQPAMIVAPVAKQ